MRSGNKPIDGLKKELLALCQSDSLSEDGLREIIIERYGAPKNPNITDYVFFHVACRNDRVTEGILRLLLEYFPDATSFHGSGEDVPLHYMCWNKNVTLGMVKLLIDAYPESPRRANNEGTLPLHCLCGNREIDGEAALEILKYFIDRCPESVRHTTDIGSLPLHDAASYQSPEFCRILIEAYPGSERMNVGNHGLLPFHWACQYNTVATVKYFYQLYPESISMASNNELYPIHYVMEGLTRREGDDPEAAVEVIQFLLDCNTDVALQKHQDKFPLYWVCDDAVNDNTPKLNAYIEILQILYDAYPEAIDEITSYIGRFCQEVQTFINAKLTYARQARDHHLMTTPDERGQLPLHRALRDNATLGSIKLLVKGNPSATRNFDDRGMIPLHMACQHHHSPSVVEYMIDLCSSAVKMKDLCQNTLLHFACRGANHAMIAFLLEKYDAAFISTRNSSKQLPIDLLFDSEAVSDREGIEYMESIYRLIRANPETVMGCNMNMNVRQQAQSDSRKKRKKVDDMK